MCCCAEPNVNGELGYSWDGKNVGTHPVAPPSLGDRDVLLFDEPGRCGGIDSHRHHYRLVKNSGTTDLLACHGGGVERIHLPHGFSLEAMDSNARYWILNAIYHAYADGKRTGAETSSQAYRSAFEEGRLKKRKMPGRNAVKIWIEI